MSTTAAPPPTTTVVIPETASMAPNTISTSVNYVSTAPAVTTDTRNCGKIAIKRSASKIVGGIMPSIDQIYLNIYDTSRIIYYIQQKLNC